MVKEKNTNESMKLVIGDDAIDNYMSDFFDFKKPATELTKQLHIISQSSGVCCGVIGPWGSGKTSFMKLMERTIKKDYSEKKVLSAWFTAWDPGGIQELGDAMLYQFFKDIVGDNEELNNTFDDLKLALGTRRNLKNRTRKVLDDISETLPTTGKVVTKIASRLLGELEASRTVKDCFSKLMEWLEKEECTVFFFIDDIDRASGIQIRDLLSEIKVYMNHRRIIAVLGYDENYVLNALKSPVLPEGTNPKKYLEKIVTLRQSVPTPSHNDMINYADELLNSILKLPHDAPRIGSVATNLCSNSPRRLKNLVLAFSQCILSGRLNMKLEDVSFEQLASLLIVTAANQFGFLSDETIRETFRNGQEDEIIEAIQEFANKNTDLRADASNLINAVRFLQPEFTPGSLWILRLHSRERQSQGSPYYTQREEKRETYNWKKSFQPIVSNAAEMGFEIPSEFTSFSNKIVIPPLTKLENLTSKYGKKSKIYSRVFRRVSNDCFVLSCEKTDVFIMIMSLDTVGTLHQQSIPTVSRRVLSIIRTLYNNIPLLVFEKNFILWLIDDVDIFDLEYIKRFNNDAKEISKGLKNKFIFEMTPSKKINELLSFLLNIKNDTK